MSSPTAPIARSAAARALAGVRSISTFAFSTISRTAAASVIAATSSAATVSACVEAGSHGDSPASTASEPARSPAKWSALERSAGLP